MQSRNFYNAILTVATVLVLSVSGVFAQGKHGGGGGHGHDGDHGNGGGQEKHQNRGNEDHGNRGNGNGNGWGREKHGDDGQRAYQQQMRQQQDWGRQQQRQNEQAQRQQQRQNEWNQRQQQAYRQQQQMNERAVRDQQRAYQQQARDQQRAYQQQQRYARIPQVDPVYPTDRHDNGRHLGWYKNGKAYGAREQQQMWQSQFRDWRRDNSDYDNDGRRDRRRDADRNVYYNNYSYADPIVNYLPVYQQQYYRPSGSTRENIVRSLISSFFGVPQQPSYYQPYQSYQAYQPYQGYQPAYYQQPYYSQPYYSNASYSPSYGYASPYNGGYAYDPYLSNGYQPYYGTQMFAGGGLKSTLLNVGLSMLQGLLGNGYQQGLNQGQYVRDYYGRPVTTYYDPYAAAQPAYYSPIASSFADQRQLLEEGYRLGYRDAMLDRDPYGNAYTRNAPVDLVSQFLANTLVNRI